MAKILDDDAEKVINELEKCRSTYFNLFEKQASKLQILVKELIEEPMNDYEQRKESGEDVEEPKLTVMAQYLIEKDVDKIKQTLEQLVSEHKGYHKMISRCGKDLDKNFEANLSGLIKNEKDLENNVQHKQQINQMMYDYFLEKGMIDVANTLKMEAELPIESTKDTKSDIDKVMYHFRSKNLIPVMEVLEKRETNNHKECKELLFQLYRQHIILLLTTGNKKESILLFSRKLQSFGEEYSSQIAQIMGAVVSYPETGTRYSDLFHPNTWQVLEAKIIKYISGIDSPLETLLTVGAKAMPPMLSIKHLLGNGSVLNSDELPVSIDIPNPVHSTFTCPILKTQSSESNPPMRLGCGHVISKDAVTKLSQARPPTRSVRPSRHNNKMKCPYCPEEINTHENKRLTFN